MYFCSKYKNWEHMTTSIDIARRIAEVNHPLSRESVHALAEILVCRKYRKGEIVLQAGEVCKAMLFIEKGMLRQFYYKYDKDLTEHIGYENGMIICIESYFKQEPTRLMVETLEASVVSEVTPCGSGEIDRSISRYRTSLSRFYRTFFDRVTGEGGHASF